MNSFDKVKDFQDKLIGKTPEIPEVLFEGDGEAPYDTFDYVSHTLTVAEDSLKRMSGAKALQTRLMTEELIEFSEAKTIVDQADALIDLIYICMGGLARMGLDGQKLFDVVHDANMTKLWEDGKPRFDEQGKLMKPPHFVRPEALLQQEIKRQMKDRGY